MPDVWVFPGGRVDRSDATHPVTRELLPGVRSRLEQSAHPALARALAVAAIRETFEETGLVLGERRGAELRPDLEHLDYVARAITPAQSSIRYHARFFHADADALSGDLRGNGELLDLDWIPIEKALGLDIIEVTAVVLREVAERLAGASEPGVPFVHYRSGCRLIRRD
jgi:8-oxo-dGTP pyrophosphatase MutT (NUDIX family)